MDDELKAALHEPRTWVFIGGSAVILLAALAVGWFVVWSLVLARLPVVQEIFDLDRDGARSKKKKLRVVRTGLTRPPGAGKES